MSRGGAGGVPSGEHGLAGVSLLPAVPIGARGTLDKLPMQHWPGCSEDSRHMDSGRGEGGRGAETEWEPQAPGLSPPKDYNVSIHSHPLPSLLYCKARLLWGLLEEGATHPCPWRHTEDTGCLLLFAPEWKVLGGGAQRAGSGQGQGDADASFPRMV